MMRGIWLARAVVAVLFAGGLASCTLLTGVGDLSVGSDVDQAVAEAGGADVSSVGTGTDSGVVPTDDGGDATDADAGSDTDGGDACSAIGCVVVPAGFTLSAYGADQTAGCPAGFDEALDGMESPIVQSGGCGCRCTVTAQPTCPTNGPMNTTFDTDGSGKCGNGGGTTGGGCSADGFLGAFAAGNEHLYNPPNNGNAAGGACTASAQQDTSKLDFTIQPRVCGVGTVTSCDGKTCASPVTAPFKLCIEATGDIACPSGTGFNERHVVGTGGSFTCSQACTCPSVGGKCSGTLQFFDSADCSTGLELSVLVNGTCQPTTSTPDAGASYASHKYLPNAPANVGCTTGGSSTPTITVNAPTTVCCQ